MVAPPEDVAAGKRVKAPGTTDPGFPVFLVRNVKDDSLLTLNTKDGKFVPAFFTYKEASGIFAEVQRKMGKDSASVQVQAVDLALFLNSVRSEAGPRAQTYKIAAPQSALEFAKKLGNLAPLKDPRKP